MSYDDEYGTQSAGRSVRRSDRGPSGPKRATAGTATAILMLAAILGFSGGAIAGNSGGDDPPTDPAADSATQPSDDTGNDPDDSDGEDTASPEPSESDIELTLTSPQDGGEAALGESGCEGACLITILGELDPPQGDITLHLERSTDGGDSWSQECNNCTGTTSDDGAFSTRYWSGVEGENRFRLAGEDADGQRIESNEIAVNVVGDDSDDENNDE